MYHHLNSTGESHVQMGLEARPSRFSTNEECALVSASTRLLRRWLGSGFASREAQRKMPSRLGETDTQVIGIGTVGRPNAEVRARGSRLHRVLALRLHPKKSQYQNSPRQTHRDKTIPCSCSQVVSSLCPTRSHELSSRRSSSLQSRCSPDESFLSDLSTE